MHHPGTFSSAPDVDDAPAIVESVAIFRPALNDLPLRRQIHRPNSTPPCHPSHPTLKMVLIHIFRCPPIYPLCAHLFADIRAMDILYLLYQTPLPLPSNSSINSGPGGVVFRRNSASSPSFRSSASSVASSELSESTIPCTD